MIFKVLIVGNNLPLQTGFLSRASGDRVSCQMYNSIGLSLGVVRFDFQENASVVLQLWSIPYSQRMERLSQSFTKGHRAIILILRPDEIDDIPTIFNRLSLNRQTPLVIVIVGSVREAEAGSYQLDAFFESQLPVHAAQHIDEVMRFVAEGLISRSSQKNPLPMIVALNENECPIYEPIEHDTMKPPNSEEEVDEIRNIAVELGLRIVGDSCGIELNEGVAWVCMKTGIIQMEPGICRYCSHSCKRQSNICIVGTDSGWSSTEMGSRAILTIAKIYALSAGMLPSHVKKQIQRTTICTRFDPNPAIPIEEVPEEILLGFKETDSGTSLLEAAKERVKEGRLSKDVFSMLKKKLHNFETSHSY
nr:MAG: hypothetical protein AM325_08025 [Candidatus Thorarchaeota archaeon SMTZ1-45]